MTERTYVELPDGTIAIRLSDDLTVYAKALEEFPISGIYMSWAQGLIYLRCTENGAEGVKIRDVTEAVLRYSLARVKRSKRRKGKAEADQRERILKGASYMPKAGSPTPERRRRALDEGSAAESPGADAPQWQDHEQHGTRRREVSCRLRHGWLGRGTNLQADKAIGRRRHRWLDWLGAGREGANA